MIYEDFRILAKMGPAPEVKAQLERSRWARCLAVFKVGAMRDKPSFPIRVLAKDKWASGV